MKIVRGIQNVQKPGGYSVLTLGNFDGVHLGHKALLIKTAKRAKEVNGVSIVFTFEPHPLKVKAPDKCPPFLTSFREKVEIIEKIGIDMVICADFTPAFAAQNPKEFIQNVLLEKINLKEIIVGHDFTFGKEKKGTIERLQEIGKEFCFNVDVVDPIELNGEIVSSSLVRSLLTEGDVCKAARYLGRPYSLEGKVVGGHKKGSDMGFPTANIDVHHELIPHTGVYAVKVLIKNKTFNGVANIGYNPTFNRKQLSVEVHILDSTEKLYDEIIRISFIDKIRNEVFFSSVEELKTQIQKDIVSAREVIRRGIG